MSKIKIISGKYASRLINCPKNQATHPMGNRERQALFNQLGNDFSGLNVLDAFAGTGALGIEALSRGATSVDFLEKDRKAIKTLAHSLADLQIKSARLIQKADQLTTYKLIFIDPPYHNFQLPLVKRIITHLAPSGLLIVSHPENITVDDLMEPHLELLSSRAYAAARISIFRAKSQS